MKDSVFLDTNVILYSYSKTEPVKCEIANSLIFDNPSVISTQVISETANILFKKFHFSPHEVEDVILELDCNLSVCGFSSKTQIFAVRLKERYGFSYYDFIDYCHCIRKQMRDSLQRRPAAQSND